MEFTGRSSKNSRTFRKSGVGVKAGETAMRARVYFPFEVDLSGLDAL
jgi:hypothetical protein